MATVAIGKATFTNGGAETQTFTWTLVDLVTPVVFGTVPTPIGGTTLIVTTAGQGAGVAYFNGNTALTTTGGTFTMANPPDCTVSIAVIG